MVDTLHADADIDDELWQRLSGHCSEAPLVVLVMLYHAVSFVVNAFRVEPEEFAAAAPR